MELNISGMKPEQKERIKTIVALGQQFGSDPSVDKFLMGELMNAYLPEEQETEIDKLASAYGLTEDAGIGNELTNALYGELGIDPAQKAQEQGLLSQFSSEFNPEDSELGGENSYFNALMQQNPEMLSQYYNYSPEEKSFGQRVKEGYQGGKESTGWLGNALLGQIPSIIGEIGGAFKTGESDEEKRKRIKSLIGQYQSNIPNN